MLRSVTWEDEAGRKWRMLLPSDAPDSAAEDGIPAGPPSLALSPWPTAFEIRLHNELFSRGLWSLRDLTRNRAAVEAAIRSALGADVETLMALYRAGEQQQEDPSDGEARSTAHDSNSDLHDGGGSRPRSDRRLSRPRASARS